MPDQDMRFGRRIPDLEALLALEVEYDRTHNIQNNIYDMI
jgi:hypothetical protein